MPLMDKQSGSNDKSDTVTGGLEGLVVTSGRPRPVQFNSLRALFSARLGRVDLVRFLFSSRLWTGSLPWVILILLGANAALKFWREELELANEPQLNVVKAKQGKAAPDPGPPGQPNYDVRYDRSIGGRVGDFWPHIPDARKQPLVIISGMSQMYTLNDYKQGDLTIAEHIDNAIAPLGARAFGLAAPNLSHEEALLLLLAAITDPRTRPATFVFAVCFEKLREMDVRPTYRLYLASRPELVKAWRETAAGMQLRYPEAHGEMMKVLDRLSAEKERVDETFEASLRARLARAVPLVEARQDLNRQLQTQLFLLRNVIFQIKPSTKRPIIPARYQINQQFLGIIADVAKKTGVQLILYNVPLNPQSENPYIPEQYASYKNWLQEFTTTRGIPYADLEGVVPPEDWGEFMGGPDFKHFREGGHRRTASALIDAFGQRLIRRPHTAEN
jgi:hypothetical protein